jgi:hypothetical protein
VKSSVVVGDENGYIESLCRCYNSRENRHVSEQRGGFSAFLLIPCLPIMLLVAFKNMPFFMDLIVVMKTIKTVLFGKGAR